MGNAASRVSASISTQQSRQQPTAPSTSTSFFPVSSASKKSTLSSRRIGYILGSSKRSRTIGKIGSPSILVRQEDVISEGSEERGTGHHKKDRGNRQSTIDIDSNDQAEASRQSLLDESMIPSLSLASRTLQSLASSSSSFAFPSSIVPSPSPSPTPRHHTIRRRKPPTYTNEHSQTLPTAEDAVGIPGPAIIQISCEQDQHHRSTVSPAILSSSTVTSSLASHCIVQLPSSPIELSSNEAVKERLSRRVVGPRTASTKFLVRRVPPPSLGLESKTTRSAAQNQDHSSVSRRGPQGKESERARNHHRRHRQTSRSRSILSEMEVIIQHQSISPSSDRDHSSERATGRSRSSSRESHSNQHTYSAAEFKVRLQRHTSSGDRAVQSYRAFPRSVSASSTPTSSRRNSTGSIMSPLSRSSSPCPSPSLSNSRFASNPERWTSSAPAVRPMNRLSAKAFTCLFDDPSSEEEEEDDNRSRGESAETAEEDRGYKRSKPRPTCEMMGWAGYAIVSPSFTADGPRRKRDPVTISPSSAGSIDIARDDHVDSLAETASPSVARVAINTPSSRSTVRPHLDLSAPPLSTVAPLRTPPASPTPFPIHLDEPLSPTSTLHSSTSVSTAATSIFSPRKSISAVYAGSSPSPATTTMSNKPVAFPFPPSPPLPSAAQMIARAIDDEQRRKSTWEGSIACPITPSPEDARDRRKFSGAPMIGAIIGDDEDDDDHVSRPERNASEGTKGAKDLWDRISFVTSSSSSIGMGEKEDKQERENDKSHEQSDHRRLGSPSKRGFSKGEIRQWISCV